MPMTAEMEQCLDVRGCRIRYMEKGSGAPILYLHGYTGLKRWAPFQEELAKSYRVIATEIPGFGESERPKWVTSMDDLAFFYLDILDALQVERAIWLGTSLGGWLAADFSARYPSRVLSLVLVDALGLYLREPGIPDVFILSPEEHHRLRYYHPEQLPEEEPDFLEMARAQSMTARLGWNPRLHDPKLEHRLHRVQAPTLLVWGESDQIVPVAYARRYQELIPHAQLAVIPESGHVPQSEQPERFLQAVLRFLHRP